MSDNLSAAYQLLNNANNSFRRAFEELAQGLDAQRQAFELLRVNTVLEALPTVVPSLPSQPKAGVGCKVTIKIWAREKLSGSLIVEENGQKANFKFGLFEYKKPNDRGLILNGSLFPKASSYDRENQVGPIWVFANQDGSRRITGHIQEGPVNNMVQYDGIITAINNRITDDAPHFEMICQTNTPFLKATAQTQSVMTTTPQPANTMNVAATPATQLVADNVLTGLVSTPGAPADPVVGNPLTMPTDALAQMMAQAPAAPDTEVLNSSVADIRKLLQ